MSSGRLVLVSNRVVDPRKPAAGGLAVALGDVVADTGGMWFGWSGQVIENGAPKASCIEARPAASCWPRWT